MGSVDTLRESIEVCKKRSRAGVLRLAFVPDTGVVKGRAQWWDPRMKDTWSAGVLPPWRALAWQFPRMKDTWRALAQEKLPGGEREHAARVPATEGRKLRSWNRPEVSLPVVESTLWWIRAVEHAPRIGAPSKAVVDSTRLTMRKIADGKRGVKAWLAAKGSQRPALWAPRAV